MKKTIKILMAIMVLSIVGVPKPVSASTSVAPTITRLSSSNRVKTSIEISKKAYVDSVETLLISGYNGDPDALTSSFLAGRFNAPLLISDKNELSKDLAAEIKRLNPKEIILLGSDSVLPKTIENSINKLGYKTRRIAGANRMETAVNIAKEQISKVESKEIFVVEYNSLADAIAIGPVAARDSIPILIVKKDSLPKSVINFIKTNGINKATIIGGNLSSNTVSELKSYVKDTELVMGSNRVNTSLEVAYKYYSNPDSVIIANGWNSTDALVGGYFAGMLDSPIILTSNNDLNNDIIGYLSNSNINKAYLLGGESVLTKRVYDLTKWALDRVDGTFEEKPSQTPPMSSEGPTTTPKPDTKPSIPSYAKLIKTVKAENYYEFDLYKKLPNGGSITKMAISNAPGAGGATSFTSGVDNNGDMYIVTKTLSGDLLFKYRDPNLTSNDINTIYEEITLFFNIYGHDCK